ncbi:MAG: VWA domain-containing protein [Candidatus Sulfotelmatobacter sp.]
MFKIRNSSTVLNHGLLKQASIVLCLLAFLPIGASGQSPLDDVHVLPRTPLIATVEPGAKAYDAIRPVIRKSADLVLVPVSVTDTFGRLVTGLRSDNFQVFENKKPQEIRHFSSDDAPVSLGIIVDTSGSMKDKMERVREAVKQFCYSANPQDEFFMITFSDTPQLVHDFTNSADDLESKLLFASARGRTALLDAIYMGIKKMREAKYSRKALLIVSDGGDNHSRYSEAELKSIVKESDVMIYAIGTFDRNLPTLEEMLGPELLSNIAEITGGRAFVLDNLIEMPDVARMIGVELRTQYILGYHPSNPPHDGKWRKISVKLKLPKKLTYLQARSKQGYYASSD